jgi:hypothetical protein
MPNLQKDLEKFIEQNREGGVELTFNLVDFEGVIADAVYNDETKLLAYKLLAPIGAMLQDRTHVASVKQCLYEKSKGRITIHTTGDNMLIFRKPELIPSLFVLNNYQLSDEDRKLLRYSLLHSVN